MKLVLAPRPVVFSRIVPTMNGPAVVTASLLGEEEIHFAPPGTAEARTRRDLDTTLELAELSRQLL